MIIEEKYYRRLNIPSGDLRISITDACNMSCEYCHNEGQGVAGRQMLRVDEVGKIVDAAKRYGLSKVRITGGEPLVHPDIEQIVETISRDLGVSNLGINTNAFFARRLLELCATGMLSQVVVGMDYYFGRVSKRSAVGPSPDHVRDTVLRLKEEGVNVQIASVYDGNERDIISLIGWALENGILIKVLEVSTGNRRPKSCGFDRLRDRVRERFGMRVGMTADLGEVYLFDNEGGKVLFFQSHCDRGECDTCRNLHLRVTCRGEAKPCLFREDTTYSLLSGDIDDAFKRAISNMGNGPGGEVV